MLEQGGRRRYCPRLTCGVNGLLKGPWPAISQNAQGENLQRRPPMTQGLQRFATIGFATLSQAPGIHCSRNIAMFRKARRTLQKLTVESRVPSRARLYILTRRTA
jgi:hypothetical protein